MKMKKFMASLLVSSLVVTSVPAGAFAASNEPVVNPDAIPSVTINEINFPDANFRKYIETKFDINQDGTLQGKENYGIKQIDCRIDDRKPNPNMDGIGKINSFVGIEHLVNLNYLDCTGNPITDLNVSQNENLEWLYLDNCNLSNIDVTQNSSLKGLRCGNNNLTQLDVTKNPLLVHLTCSKNKLTQLNLNNNPDIGYLFAENNMISEIDLSNKKLLHTAQLSNNNLSSLNLKNDPELVWVYFNDNQIEGIDLSSSIKLDRLEANNNKLNKIDLSNNPELRVLSLHHNQLQEIDLSNNTKLDWLGLIDNQLTSLDISKNTNIQEFYAYANNFNVNNKIIDCSTLPGNFDINKVSNEEGCILDKANNTITLADFGKYTYEYEVAPGKNVRFNLIFTRANEDEYIYIDEKNFPDETFRSGIIHLVGSDRATKKQLAKIESIDVPIGHDDKIAIKSFKGIELLPNLKTIKVTSEYFDEVVENLPSQFENLICYNMNGKVRNCDSLTSICSYDGHIEIENCPNLKKFECSNPNYYKVPDTLDLSLVPSLEEISIGTEYKHVDISKNINLKNIFMSVTIMEGPIDLSKCKNLTSVSLYPEMDEGDKSPDIEAIILGNHPNLKSFSCINLPLKEINVTGCPNLESFSCVSSHIKTIDLSKCTKLKRLELNANRLVCLDLTGLANLKESDAYWNSIKVTDKTVAMDIRDPKFDGNKVSNVKGGVFDKTKNTFTFKNSNQITYDYLAKPGTKVEFSLWLANKPGVGNIIINEENFPDATLRNALIDNYYGTEEIEGVYVISDEHAEDITELYLYDTKIKNYKGIELFKNLKELDFYLAPLEPQEKEETWEIKNIDSIEKIYISDCEHKNVELNNLPNLKDLEVSRGDSKTFKINQCPKLNRAKFGMDNGYEPEENERMALENLELTGLNELRNLDLTLTSIKNLDLSGCPNLNILKSHMNLFEELDLSKNPELFKLVCEKDKLSNVIFAKDAKLRDIILHETNVSSLDLDNCSKNEIRIIDLDNNKTVVPSQVVNYEELPGNFDPDRVRAIHGAVIDKEKKTITLTQPIASYSYNVMTTRGNWAPAYNNKFYITTDANIELPEIIPEDVKIFTVASDYGKLRIDVPEDQSLCAEGVEVSWKNMKTNKTTRKYQEVYGNEKYSINLNVNKNEKYEIKLRNYIVDKNGEKIFSPYSDPVYKYANRVGNKSMPMQKAAINNLVRGYGSVKVFAKKITYTNPKVTYRYAYRLSGSNKWNYKTSTSNVYTIKGLRHGRNYQVKTGYMYTSKLDGHSKIYGNFSPIKTVRVR